MPERRRKFYGLGYEDDAVSPEEISEFEVPPVWRFGRWPCLVALGMLGAVAGATCGDRGRRTESCRHRMPR
jgi:hypothetical protein